jgi:hypothetical protein
MSLCLPLIFSFSMRSVSKESGPLVLLRDSIYILALFAIYYFSNKQETDTKF